ncbi:MAG: cupin domain-containing protein [Firmicutes bacterium]|nr:cupin domain-containing protein [Bacillota bacterium]
MQITVKKPTEQEVEQMQSNPTWGCGVSKFDWHYDQEETCLIIEGEVVVTGGGQSVSIKKGDYVTFARGLSCVWDVKKPIKKYYEFR